jgi:membrane protein DedA with SNARE-associated domain
VVGSRSQLDLPAVAALLALGVFHTHLHGGFDYAGVALAAAASWIGVPGPGEPVLIAAGIFAARGRVDIVEVLLVAWAGATAGGVAGWLIGRRGGRALGTVSGPFLRIRLAALARGERFFERYGALGVYLAPSWITGINGMRAARFLPLNAFWALVWTLVVGGGAYLIGPSIEDVVADLGLVGGIVLALLVLAGIGGALLRRRGERPPPGDQPPAPRLPSA